MSIITTNKANCRDCYKCVRECPTNAIKVHGGHAQVDPDRCILCGLCYKTCPQGAKTVRDDIEAAKEIIKTNDFVIASIAPSFFAYYDEEKRGKIIKALQYLGFNLVEQTSRGVKTVSDGHIEFYKNADSPVISSSCPAIVNLVEKYYPDLIKLLAPVVSPIVAHGKILESEYRKPIKVIFISPCIAKKEEIEGTEISASITFEELENWIESEGIELNELAAENFRQKSSRSSTLFPLPGGLMKRAGLPESSIESEFISVSGVKNSKDLLNLIQEGKIKSGFIELLACEGGCVNGPCKPKNEQGKSHFELKKNLIQSQQNAYQEYEDKTLSYEMLQRSFSSRASKQESCTEEQIQEVLQKTGKKSKEDEHNCGACGYNTCREKAIAVIKGMAEAEMCIPYMRSKAERLASTVIKNTPNGIIFLDKEFRVVDVNPAFVKMFHVKLINLEEIDIKEFFSTEDFKNIDTEKESLIKSVFKHNDKRFNRLVFTVPDKNLIICIFVDITDAEEQRIAMNKTKRETLERAQKVIDKQMRVAQEIAGLLGESTAETKVLLGQLVKTLQED